MKTSKVLSIILAVVLLFACTSVAVSAEEPVPALSFEVSGSYALAGNVSVSPTIFSYDLQIDDSKICALDGESKAYTYEMKSLVANGVDYMTDPDAFFESFSAEDYEGTMLEVTFVINFESDKVFGTLNYDCGITGFMQPLQIGLGPVDDALSNVALPVDVTVAGNVWDFPATDSIVVLQRPTKQDYLDTEKFDLTGTTIEVSTIKAASRTFDEGSQEYIYTYEPGYTGTITFGPETTNMFTCNPHKNDKLSVHSTEVIAYFDGIEIAKLPVNVEHAWAPDYVSITTDKYTPGKPGYHAIVCDGCGEAHDAKPHNPSPVLDENGNPVLDEYGEPVYWVSNNDQTFVGNGTVSSTCQDCGAILTADMHGTADYNDAFANYHFLRVIFDYINALLRLIGAAGIH